MYWRSAGFGSNKNKTILYNRTFDGGDSWKEIPLTQMPAARPGEAIFAGSGTNISFFDNPDIEYGFVTGGAVSNLHLAVRRGKPNKTIHIPVIQAKETAGTFSMAINKQKEIYCIGGDYKHPKDNSANFTFTTNAGVSWNQAMSAPFGYRSCIQIIKDKTLVACGTTGVDFARNGQKKWEKVSAESFNVCMVSKGKQVFFAGEKGKVGKLIF